MARLRQEFPSNYVSSGNINTEFENLIRYINAAELGDKTVGELFDILFDEDGVFDGPIELRKDSSLGIQWRVGTYTDVDAGWVTLVSLADITGAAGSVVGEIGAPIFHTRSDQVAATGGTGLSVFDYAHVSTDEILVYVNGILKRSGSSYDYVTSTTAGSASAGAVTFNANLTNADKVTIFKVRTTSITGYTRTDYVTTGTQSVFAFVHDSDTSLNVYKNGILQREGGSYDYTSDATSNTVTFTTGVTTGNTVTIFMVENVASQAVTGIMLEANFVDTANGLIDFPKISIAPNGSWNNVAMPVAVVPELVPNVTVGIEVYPEPPDVIVIALTAPEAIVHVAAAPVPPPPENKIDGAEEYPAPAVFRPVMSMFSTLVLPTG